MLSAWHDPTKLHKSLCSRTHVRPTYLFLLLQTSHELERLTGPFEWETKFKISNRINEIIHCVRSRDILINIHITAASRAEQYIARVHACDILYVPEGFSPRRTYFRIARRARVLYDFSAREARLIWIISTSVSFF